MTQCLTRCAPARHAGSCSRVKRSGHYLDDGIDVDGDGVFELDGTVVGVTLVVTCNPGYSCSRPRVTTGITTDPETGVDTTVYTAQADWVHEPGRKFYRAGVHPRDRW